MINKDKIFRQIVKDLKIEILNLKKLPVSSIDVYDTTICPLIKMVANKYLKSIDIYYSFNLNKTSFSKEKDLLEMFITFSIKNSEDHYFKEYNFILSFENISSKNI